MSYHFSTTVSSDFDQAVDTVTARLKEKGFGVLTTIDVQATMKAKLDVDMPRYTILGSCNPQFAHQALQAEPHIGTMLPCNVVVREIGDGAVEVSAVDPVASMQAIDNPDLGAVATQVRAQLREVIEQL
jgi:uncharacterized protein (DUF302 family)